MFWIPLTASLFVGSISRKEKLVFFNSFAHDMGFHATIDTNRWADIKIQELLAYEVS